MTSSGGATFDSRLLSDSRRAGKHPLYRLRGPWHELLTFRSRFRLPNLTKVAGESRI